MLKTNVAEKQKSITVNTIYYLIYTFLNISFPLITGIYVAHVLLPSSIGQVEAARNLSTYFVIFAFIGIPTYGLREVAKYRDNKTELSKVFSELFIINFISTTIFLALYIFLIFFVSKYRDNIWLYMISGISIALNYLNISWLYEGLEKFRFISLRNIVFKVISFAALVIFVRKPNDMYWYAAISIIGTAGNYLWNFLLTPKYVRPTFKNLNLKRHMKPVLFLFAVNLAIEIYTLVDITMLDWLKNDEDVTFYAYAAKIKVILLQLVNTFTIVIVPRLANYFKNLKKKQFNDLLSKAFSVLIIISIPIVVGVFFTSDYLLTTIYGPDYIQASTVLKILVLDVIISPIGYLLGSRVCLTTGHENKMIMPVVVGAIANALLNWLLIPSLSCSGAALASVISECIVCLIYLTISRKYYSLNISEHSKIAYVISIGLLVFYLCIIDRFFEKPELVKTIVEIFGAVVIYFSSLLLMKEKTTLSLLMRLRKKKTS